MSRRDKILISVVNLLISIAVVSMQVRPPTQPPWGGMYKPYLAIWLLIFSCAILLIAVTENHWTQILACTLLAGTIVLLTLQWGTVFAIRDSWVHFGRIQDYSYMESMRYPAFHTLIETLSVITQINLLNLIRIFPVISAMVGVTLLGAVATKFTSKSQSITPTIVVLIPAVLVDFRGRPIAMTPALVLTAIIIGSSTTNPWLKRSCLAILALSLSFWHPLALVLFTLISSCLLVSYLSISYFPETIVPSSRIPDQYRSWINMEMLVLIGSIFVAHFLYGNRTGRLIAASVVRGALSPESGSDSSGGTASEGAAETGPPLLIQVVDHLQEALAMSGVVIMMGLLTLAGILFSRRNTNRRILAASTLLAGIIFAGLFAFMDLVMPVSFSVTRALPLAPILLLIGAVIGLDEIHYHIPNAASFIALIIIVIGLALLFPSPLTGTIQTASTPSDIDRSNWLVKYQSEAPVIDSENTYQITRGVHGQSRAESLGNNNKWNYQSATRTEPLPWRVNKPEEGALIVIHEITRELAGRNYDAKQEAQEYGSSTDQIYDVGHSEVYWATPNSSSEG